MEELNLCFIGDELIAGYGDARALGWTGRVMARTHRDPAVLWTELAVPGENTRQLAARWQEEVARRSSSGRNLLVVGVGVADIKSGLSTARSRLALANILDAAMAERRECFVVGPPPLLSVDQDQISALNAAAAEVCNRREVPYVDTFTPLRNHEQWNTDLLSTGGTHPGQAGYGLLAWLVLHRGWFEWLGVDAPAA